MKSYYLSQNPSAKMQIQSLTAKKLKPKKSRLKDLKLTNKKISALSYTNKLEKLFYQKKKKKYLKKKSWEETKSKKLYFCYKK